MDQRPHLRVCEEMIPRPDAVRAQIAVTSRQTQILKKLLDLSLRTYGEGTPPPLPQTAGGAHAAR